MATYQVNRGVGKPVEFFGLRAQYVIYLVFLTICIILFSFILSFLHFNVMGALLIGIIAFLLAVCSCFKLNNTYGEHGLMQHWAAKKVVKHISVTRRIYQIVEDRDENI